MFRLCHEGLCSQAPGRSLRLTACLVQEPQNAFVKQGAQLSPGRVVLTFEFGDLTGPNPDGSARDPEHHRSPARVKDLQAAEGRRQRVRGLGLGI